MKKRTNLQCIFGRYCRGSLVNLYGHSVTLLFACALHLAPAIFGQEIELQPGTVLYFASLDEARERLSTSDAYTRAMTPLDRSLQMKTNGVMTEEQFLQYAGGEARAWSADEIAALTNLIHGFRTRVAALDLPFPPRIPLIRATGAESFQSAYVRSGAIVFPTAFLTEPMIPLGHIFVHELFHVLSSQNPHLRPALYSILGYIPVGQVEIPAPIRDLRLTNPDYYENTYAVQAPWNGRVYTLLPVMHSVKPEFTGESNLFDYATFFFFELKQENGRWIVDPAPAGPVPEPVLSEFFTRIGIPEYTVFQPEETLADLFPHVVFENPAVRSPRLTYLLREALRNPGRFRGPASGIFDAVLTVSNTASLYVVEITTNLTDWTVVDKVSPVGSEIWFDDRDAWHEGRRFYRARTAPVISREPGSTNEMVWIEPGAFVMGSDPSEPGFQPFEGPPTEVTLTRGFWIGKYEVTQGEYVAVLTNNPSPPPQDPGSPVFNLTWTDAQNYCAALTAKARAAGTISTNFEYRLPTEAEWEYACRAGTTNAHYWSADPDQKATYLHEWLADNSGTRVHAVGLKLPNAWGLYDMLGNVSEFCADGWTESLPGGQRTDPFSPPSSPLRVVRGGEFFSFPYWARSGSRRPFEITQPGVTGFRIVLAEVR